MLNDLISLLVLLGFLSGAVFLVLTISILVKLFAIIREMKTQTKLLAVMGNELARIRER